MVSTSHCRPDWRHADNERAFVDRLYARIHHAIHGWLRGDWIRPSECIACLCDHVPAVDQHLDGNRLLLVGRNIVCCFGKDSRQRFDQSDDCLRAERHSAIDDRIVNHTVVKYLIAALMLPGMALAANTATLTWDYTSNDPANDNPTFQVYQGLQGQAKVAGPSTTDKAVTISAGMLYGNTYCWVVTTKAHGDESLPSNEACKTFPYPVPTAPISLQVN